VITAKHDWDRARCGDFAHLPIDLTVTVLDPAWHHGGITRVNGGEDAEWIDTNLE
jgi:hypothetical protein